MHKVSKVASALNTSDTTVRNWVKEFADYLSPDASPPKGQPRTFDDEDLKVLATVADLRQRSGASYEDIHKVLATGERRDFVDEDEDAPTTPPPEAPPSAKEQTALITKMTATVARFEGELTATKEALDHAREELAAERLARVDAEKRATAAETALSLLTTKPPPENAPQAQNDAPQAQPGERRRWWQFWKG